MEKTKKAVLYVAQVLNISPDDVFNLIASTSTGVGVSDDFCGSYPLWLASKVIEVADSEGIKFSQLLVKKFAIINSLREDIVVSPNKLNSDFKSWLVDEFGGSYYSLIKGIDYSEDLAPINKELQGVDFYKGVDLSIEDNFFSRKLPSKVLEDIKSSNLKLYLTLSNEPVVKSDLLSEAKGMGIKLHTKGAMMLYRLCSLQSVYGMGEGTKVIVTCPTEFLYNPDNDGVLDLLLRVYTVTGKVLMDNDYYSDALNLGSMAVMVLKPRLVDDELQGSILLDNYGVVKNYSKSSVNLLDKLVADTSAGVHKLEDILGYLTVKGSSVTLNSSAVLDAINIPITKGNFEDVVIYYSSSKCNLAYLGEPKCVINGHREYKSIFYNALVLFLYDSFNNLEATDKYKELVSSYVDLFIPYLCFEAKELYDYCSKAIVQYEADYGVSISFKNLRSTYNGFDKETHKVLYNKLAGYLSDKLVSIVR